MRGERFGLNSIFTIFIDVDHRICCLRWAFLPAIRFSENYFFDFETDIHVAKTPPCVLFTIINEGVVVPTFGCTFVHQNTMEIVWNIAVVSKSCLNLILLLLNLSDNLGLFSLNWSLVSLEDSSRGLKCVIGEVSIIQFRPQLSRRRWLWSVFIFFRV